MPGPDTRDIGSLAGAMYFIVGRGTEGGPFPYRLSITGITAGSAEPHWGRPEMVVANSGYSLGTIQVDLGQRGTWPLGATENAPLRPGQSTYVDGLIAEAAGYAQEHHREFTSDRAQLRAALLSHGNGEAHRGTLVFIDTATRDSFNAWASSASGQQWIHRNIDYPQIRNATQLAFDMVEASGRNISDDRRLETIAILAKTANQMPAQMAGFRNVLQAGGNYDDVLAKANDIQRRHHYYAGPKAAALAERYKGFYKDAPSAAALDRAHLMVADPGFSPSTAASDPDFRAALEAVGQAPRAHVLRQGAHGDEVVALQHRLATLGITDAAGRALEPDGAFGPGTRHAVEAFQRAQGLRADGLVGPATLAALQEAARRRSATLADGGHPGNALFRQALRGVHLIDARCGRTPDGWSDNLAGSLATAAHARGLERIDHVVLGDNATRAFAVQGALDSPFRRSAGVEVLQAIATPLGQSSLAFHALPPERPQPADAMRVREALVPPSPAGVGR